MLKLRRDFSVGEVTETDGVFEIAFSSETPVQREILDEYNQPKLVNEILLHESPDNADLTRINNGAALLFNHDFDKHLGIVVPGSVRIDSDKIGRAKVQFSKHGELAQEVGAKVAERTISKISFGYDLVEYEVQGNDLLVSKWAPYEISFVTVPADDNVGLGRSLNINVSSKRAASNLKENKEMAKRIDEMTAEELVDMTIDEIESLSDEDRAKREEMIEEIEAAEAAGNDEVVKTESDSVATGNEVPEKDELTAEEREEEIEEIEEIAERYKVSRGEVRKAIAKGMTARQFKRSIKPQSKSPAVIRKMNKDTKQNLEARFDLGNAMRALANGKNITGAEAEYHQEAVRKLRPTRGGSEVLSRGIQIPMSVFGTRAMNNSASLDPIKQETKLYGSFVEMLLGESVVSKLGINVESGLTTEVAVPKQTASSVDAFGFVQEDGDAPEGDSKFADIKLKPHTFAGGNPITRQAINTMPNISAFIADHIVKFSRAKLEQLMFGSKDGGANAPDSIVKQLTDLGAVESMGMSYKEFLKFAAKLTDLGVSQDEFKYLMSGVQAADLQSTLRTDNVSNYIITDDFKLGGRDVITSGVIKPAQAIAGDFSGITVAEWAGLSLDIDDTTYRNKGKIVPRVWCDLDWKVTAEDRLKLVTLKAAASK
ncbi:phage major capsid family protein [Serratia marcescens]|uniref:phage major capsid family protein n=1 Tax=Serratia marcescens TaxID=615 RepID=UPI001F154EFD|nr:phage major capsid protein [Serratia marcescens]MDP8728356.1 phage major capsid protein [Serratia marcescens]